MTDSIELTLPMRLWREREAEWTAQGWMIMRVATYRSKGERWAKVTLTKEENK